MKQKTGADRDHSSETPRNLEPAKGSASQIYGAFW